MSKTRATCDCCGKNRWCVYFDDEAIYLCTECREQPVMDDIFEAPKARERFLKDLMDDGDFTIDDVDF